MIPIQIVNVNSIGELLQSLLGVAGAHLPSWIVLNQKKNRNLAPPLRTDVAILTHCPRLELCDPL